MPHISKLPATAALLFVLVLFVLVVSGQATAADPLVEELPEGWRVERTSEVAAEQRTAIGSKLGGRIDRLTNTVLSVHGKRLQINTLQAATAEGAGKIEQSLLKLKPNPRLVHRQGQRVVELVCDDIRLALDARYQLGIQPKKVSYRLAFDAAPITSGDYMSWNRMFNLYLERERAGEGQTAAVDAKIAELAKGFQFGNRLIFRRYGLGAAESQYTLKPEAVPSAIAGDELCAFHFFVGLPRKAGLPMISVEAKVTSETYSITPSERADEALLRPTVRWPANDAKIKQLAGEITQGCTTDDERVQAILEWLLPGKNVRYDGKIVGSRYGTAKVLEQRFGHCWDFSDLIVTLCRAAGVPSRQVGGWLYGQSGHVWAEYLVGGKGWKQVDPTAGMACGSDYIPYLTTEDGEWPLVYVAPVRIEVIER